ncbi:MAG TPA: hypothetical protein VFZ65_07975 [Planctomycetota bacterium]|nr:hypothetical protein [Planctomycetota bacterium]
MHPAARALLTLMLLPQGSGTAQTDEPVTVPRIWDAERLRDWALPLAGLGEAPGFLAPERYYALPVDDLRTYPVYHPAREPKGYRDELLRRGPSPLIEPGRLHTRADWLAAGQRVFEELDTWMTRTDDPAVLAHFTDAAAVDRYRDADHDAMDQNGVLLDYRWVVDRDNKLKLSVSSCAGCHSRLMPDGSVLAGAPSNYDLSAAPAVDRLLAPLRTVRGMTPGELTYMAFGVPWREHDENERFKTMSAQDLAAFLGQPSGAPPGTTFDRFNGSPFHTTRMADLRGIAHRRYLDTTGTHRNREPADVARYAILVEFADVGVFGPHQMVPAQALELPHRRPSDAAVFAMALYLYSLDVPPSPHALDEQARRGAAIFADEGCKKCHPPPHYTNDELVPAPGFTPAADDARTPHVAVMDRTVDTDPGLALRTRKGTGYYRVPSLRGLWYRGLFEHSGSVATLEDWFDARRLEQDYVPTGWRGPGVTQRAVPGHEFGLDLEPADKAALIAFLRTL